MKTGFSSCTTRLMKLVFFLFLIANTLAQNSTNVTTTAFTCSGNEIPGRMYFSSPISTSFAFSGSSFNVSWFYGDFTPLRPTRKLTLRYTLSSLLGTNNPWNLITDSIPSSATSYIWTIPPLADGMYSLYLHADDIILATTCAPSGFPIPVNSQSFSIYNQKSLNVFPDEYAPTSDCVAMVSGLFLMMAILIL